MTSLSRARALVRRAAAGATAAIVACSPSGDDQATSAPSTGDDATAPTASASGDDATTPPGTDGGPDAIADAPFEAEPIDAGPPRLIEHVVAPKTADPTVTTYLEDEYAYLDTRVKTKNVLVLYLAGASGTPVGTVPMMKEIASYGYHVAGVRYVNDYLIVDICNADPDPDCHGKLRLEALDGVDHSAHITVPPENAIETRLAKLLAHLAATSPGEGWANYLDAGKLRWPSIAVAGHSHGASASGRIGKVRPTAGVAMLAGPYDSRGGQPIAWELEASMTPPAKVFAFAHSADTQYTQDLANWAAMGLPGAPTSVDEGAAPFGGTHRFTSSRAGGGHGSVAAGGASPMQGGAYVYRPVWKLMFP